MLNAMEGFLINLQLFPMEIIIVIYLHSIFSSSNILFHLILIKIHLILIMHKYKMPNIILI